ncbi:MAG TPA: MMPL family transporter, partial [Catenuloplanes sp.]
MAATRTRRALFVAVAVVLAWLVIGGIAGPYSGKLSEVATNDNASFLPADAEATRAQELAAGFTDRPATPAVVVYERRGGITPGDRRAATADVAAFARVTGVIGPLAPPQQSDDGQALRVIVPIDDTAAGDDIGPIVEQLRAIVADSPAGLAAHVAGPAGLLADLVKVFLSIDVTLLLVTGCVVLVILLIVYRSPVLWVIPLLAAAMSYAVAATAVYFLADAELIVLNGQAQGILTV